MGHASSPSLSPPLSSPVLLTPHFLLHCQCNSQHPSGLIYSLLFHWSCPSGRNVWLSNHSQFILLFLFLWSKDSLTRCWVIYHCIMGLELFWVNTHLIRSVIPSCFPDELWESASNVCSEGRLGKQSTFCGGATMAALLPPQGPVSDKCSSLFSVSCFPHTQVGET